MNSMRVGVWAIVLLVAAVAGCAEEGSESGGDDGNGNGQTPGNGGDQNQTQDGSVMAVTVLDVPQFASPGSNVTVCWEVEGTGTIPHTAVHYDSVSHADPESFQAYAGGAVYPDNETAQAEAGYELPGPFCADLMVPEEGDLYYRAHAMTADGPPGTLSHERVIHAMEGGGNRTLMVLDPPMSGNPGEDVTVCWEVGGSGTIPHTALHYDSTSHPDASSFEDYAGGAVYPGNETAQAAEGYETPGTFCANLPMPDTGELYYRAHYIDESGPPGVLDVEHVLVPAGA